MNPSPSDSPQAVIFDIQRFSIHDGPGIRTTLFFKGCSLHCAWCQNPESMRAGPEMAFYVERCVGCGACANVCPEGAVSMDAGRRIIWENCTACGACARECPSEALRLVGAVYTVPELLRESIRDREFYDASGGGISLSGGEPVLHSRFLESFLPELKTHGIHVLLETAGNYPFTLLNPLLPFIDYIYFDYKLPHDEAYRIHTGKGNRQILDVLVELVEHPVPLTVRIPVVPGINTGSHEIKMMAHTLGALGISAVSLLKYNPLWEAKIPRLNTRQNALGIGRNAVDAVDYENITDQYSQYQITATLPS
jgi:pyruvate formate lyase activating enzyme